MVLCDKGEEEEKLLIYNEQKNLSVLFALVVMLLSPVQVYNTCQVP